MPKRYRVLRHPVTSTGEHKVTFERIEDDPKDHCKDLPPAANVTASEYADLERRHGENPSEWNCRELRQVLPRVDDEAPDGPSTHN